MAPTNCERIRTSTKTLEDVLPLLISNHRLGKRVVRLHDGDTALYSAINEQICALSDADIPVEVVPGVSAYQAAAAALNCELTVPGVVQTIVLSRAGGRTGVPDRESLQHLAALQASLCIYLSARHVDEVQATLLEHYPADTPVAVGYRVSWPDQQLETVELKEMAAFTHRHNLIRTTLYVISLLSRSDKRSSFIRQSRPSSVRNKQSLWFKIWACGRLAQWWRTSFTRKGSLVRIQYRPWVDEFKGLIRRPSRLKKQFIGIRFHNSQTFLTAVDERANAEERGIIWSGSGWQTPGSTTR